LATKFIKHIHLVSNDLSQLQHFSWDTESKLWLVLLSEKEKVSLGILDTKLIGWFQNGICIKGLGFPAIGLADREEVSLAETVVCVSELR